MSQGFDRVRCIDVSKYYGASTALRSVTFEAVAGTVTAIRGGNGSGKSTLLSIIAQATQPSDGRVEFYSGSTQLGAHARIAPQIGWLSHDLGAYSVMTPRELLELRARLFGFAVEPRVTSLIETLELNAIADQPLELCSRGQRQRASLALALLHDPSLVLLDEPTTGLDDSGITALERVIADLRERRRIVLIVTHSDTQALRWCDRQVTLLNGRAMEEQA